MAIVEDEAEEGGILAEVVVVVCVRAKVVTSRLTGIPFPVTVELLAEGDGRLVSSYSLPVTGGQEEEVTTKSSLSSPAVEPLSSLGKSGSC